MCSVSELNWVYTSGFRMCLPNCIVIFHNLPWFCSIRVSNKKLQRNAVNPCENRMCKRALNVNLKSQAWTSNLFLLRGLRLLLNVILKLQAFRCSNSSANEESESVSSDRQTSNFSPSPELGDIMSVLLDQLDISWLDPDQSVTREILSIILTFVLSFQKKGKDEKIESVQRSDDGILTKMIEGKKLYFLVTIKPVLTTTCL